MLNKTIVFITHDIIEAFRLADPRHHARGRGDPDRRPVDIVLNPADDYVADHQTCRCCRF
jgi:ABC-type proline/glycine betaine transport system ATPase subunit